MRIVLFVSIALVALLGLRHIAAVATNYDQDGTLKKGQRLCHLVSALILWASCASSIYDQSFVPLIIGILVEYMVRHAIIRSGQR
ncbi:MAG: hypothetical protein NT151_00700 [Acidobacteria bacterium]|nr:hypothetical protein [Acidobacteriota bacterium]